MVAVPSNRPTRDQLAAAATATLPDLVGPRPRVVFVGINPSLYSAAVGHHFARPGNRFWPTLHRAGFTQRLLRPDEQRELLDIRLGITNIAARPTARADELNSAELHAGWEILVEKAAHWRPAYLGVLGVTAYRLATGERRADVGEHGTLESGCRLWVLPNPSGLNAHYQLPDLATAYAALRAAASAPGRLPRGVE